MNITAVVDIGRCREQDFTFDEMVCQYVVSYYAHLQRSAKKAWLFDELQPGRARKRINAT